MSNEFNKYPDATNFVDLTSPPSEQSMKEHVISADHVLDMPKEELTAAIHNSVTEQYDQLTEDHGKSDALEFNRNQRVQVLEKGDFFDVLESDSDLRVFLENILDSDEPIQVEKGSDEWSSMMKLQRLGVMVKALVDYYSDEYLMGLESEFYSKHRIGCGAGISLHGFQINTPLRAYYREALRQIEA